MTPCGVEHRAVCFWGKAAVDDNGDLAHACVCAQDMPVASQEDGSTVKTRADAMLCKKLTEIISELSPVQAMQARAGVPISTARFKLATVPCCASALAGN